MFAEDQHFDVHTSQKLDIFVWKANQNDWNAQELQSTEFQLVTKENVKPGVSFQASDCGARDAGPARTKRRRRPRDTRQQSTRPRNTKLIPVEDWRQTKHLGGDGHVRNGTGQQKRVIACAPLPKAMPQKSHPFQKITCSNQLRWAALEDLRHWTQEGGPGAFGQH